MSANDDAREQRFKAQAERLREFLASAGVDLKHTTSLQAIACMHGAKDWRALLAGDAVPEPLRDHQPAQPSGAHQFAIVSQYPTVTTVALAPTRELALHAFLQEARMILDVYGPADSVRFVGQDMDPGLPSLVLMIDDMAWVTLQRPSIVDGLGVAKGKDGSHQLQQAKLPRLHGLEKAESFFSIAVAIGEAFATRKESDQQPRAMAASHSMAAHMMAIPFNEVVVSLAVETHESLGPPSVGADPAELLRAIDKIKLMHTSLAVLR